MNVRNKLARLAPLMLVGAMFLSACGGAATPVSPTATTPAEQPTAMMAGETPTAMMAEGTPTAMMMAGETPTAMMVETPGAMMESKMDVTLSAQNDSNQNGTATITDMGGKAIMVSINLSNGTTEPQPAHIHKGTCANLDPNPAYPLSSVVNGKSETEVPVSMDELSKGEYAINIHKSAAEVSVYVSCGDIKASGMMSGAATPGAMMEGQMDVALSAQNDSNQNGSATLTKKSDTAVMVSINLSNGTTEPQPAHIHKGTCANLDPNPAYPLNSVVNGKSETEVAVSMDELSKGEYAINIHKSATEASVYVACGDLKVMGMMGGETPGTMMEGMTDVTLSAQNDSNQTGSATLTKKGDNAVMVSITLSNGTTEPQPAHIHKGTCANLDPNPAYPLSSVVNGKSETEVPVSMDELSKGEYAINIHKSATEAAVYVACGDLKIK